MVTSPLPFQRREVKQRHIASTSLAVVLAAGPSGTSLRVVDELAADGPLGLGRRLLPPRLHIPALPVLLCLPRQLASRVAASHDRPAVVGGQRLALGAALLVAPVGVPWRRAPKLLGRPALLRGVAWAARARRPRAQWSWARPRRRLLLLLLLLLLLRMLRRTRRGGLHGGGRRRHHRRKALRLAWRRRRPPFRRRRSTIVVRRRRSALVAPARVVAVVLVAVARRRRRRRPALVVRLSRYGPRTGEQQITDNLLVRGSSSTAGYGWGPSPVVVPRRPVVVVVVVGRRRWRPVVMRRRATPRRAAVRVVRWRWRVVGRRVPVGAAGVGRRLVVGRRRRRRRRRRPSRGRVMGRRVVVVLVLVGRGRRGWGLLLLRLRRRMRLGRRRLLLWRGRRRRLRLGRRGAVSDAHDRHQPLDLRWDRALRR